MSDIPDICVKDVWFSYPTTSVLEDVNVDVHAGDFVCMVGPNGGGKTTLLRLILGLLAPDRGRIRVLDKTPRQACRRVGYMPQRTDLDPRFPVSVMDVVLMGRLGNGRAWGRYARADRDIAVGQRLLCFGQRLAHPGCIVHGGIITWGG